jgi:outer membrane protein assembly factor BamB
VIIFVTSCQNNKTGFQYDPTVSYPLLNAGDFWMDKFDQRGLQNAIIYRDRIYCNTIDVGGDNNFLYCLNPENGLVVWRRHVDAYATQPVSFQDDTVIYCSYLGHISTFDKDGKIIWKAKFNHPYGGHWLDTINSRLLVKTVYWKNVSEYDVKSGKLISDNENDSLQKLVEKKMNDERHLANREYRVIRNGKAYTLKCRPPRPDDVGDYTIEITR